MQSPPVVPEEIDALPDVHFHFQADLNFKKIYETNSRAGAMCEVASLSLQFASNMGANGGLGSLGRIVASSENSKFMLFSLNAKNAGNNEPRIFGIVTESSTEVNDMTTQITKLI